MLKQALVALLVAAACAQEFKFEDRDGCMYRRFDDLVFEGVRSLVESLSEAQSDHLQMPKNLEVPRLLKFALAFFEVTPMNVSEAFRRCNCVCERLSCALIIKS